jgi:hypothetical protein
MGKNRLTISCSEGEAPSASSVPLVARPDPEEDQCILAALRVQHT